MSQHVHVRKARAGTDSAGHHWPEDGAMIEVPVEHALTLASIPDGGFTLVEQQALQPDEPASSSPPEPESDSDEATPARGGRRKAQPSTGADSS